MKHANLKALFTAIANSIRNKTGGTDAIIADDFPKAIDGIKTGGAADYPFYDGEPLDITETEITDNYAVFKAETEPVIVDGEVAVKMNKNDLGDAPPHMVVDGWGFTSKEGIKQKGTMPIYDYTPLEAWHAGEDEENNFLFTGIVPKQLVVEDEVNLKVPKTDFGDAKPEDVRAGKIFTSAEGIEQVGTNSGVDKIQRYIELSGNSAYFLFYNFKGASVDDLMIGVDTSKVISMADMFGGCDALTSVPLFDTSRVTSMSSMFSGCRSLTTVPLFDTSKVVNMNYMFNTCPALTSVPLFDTSNVTDMNRMFDGCRSLTTVPLFDTSKVKYMGSMFSSCEALTTVPSFDTRNVTNMGSMFSSCEALTTVPSFDTRNVTNMERMFFNCHALTTVPSFDTRNVTNMDSMHSMFYNCQALTEIWIRNIKANLEVSDGTSYGNLLTLESLLHLCKECINVNTSRTLFVGTANLAKLASVYVKLIDITDDMRAEDDLIDEKYPFVQCDSTDEGAMTIQDYMATKRWILKG